MPMRRVGFSPPLLDKKLGGLKPSLQKGCVAKGAIWLANGTFCAWQFQIRSGSAGAQYFSWLRVFRESPVPAVVLTAKLRLTLGLCAALLAPPVFACPAGQTEVCVVSCFCAPGGKDEVAALLDPVKQMAAVALQSWLLQAHRAALLNEMHSMPLQIRAQLTPFYSEQLLDLVRYQVGADTQLNAANAMLQNPDVNAVTLLDIVVFRHAEDAQNNTLLWAHELKHVQQYQEWGVEGFASRYSRDYRLVEAPAYAMQSQVRFALRAAVEPPKLAD
jgi:hypothetical protein